MQAEHSRGSGFVISPLTVTPDFTKIKKPIYKPSRIKIRYNFFENISKALKSSVLRTFFIRKHIFFNSLSVCVAICCLMVFFNYFTVGTAIYNNGKIVAYTEGSSDFYTALSSARSYAEDNSITNIQTDFITVPAITLKQNISKNTTLRDKLLLSTPQFVSACTLYSGNTAVFNAENEQAAKEAVSEYISEMSVDGKADVEDVLTYRQTILPHHKVSSLENCKAILSQSKAIEVISVVSTSFQKQIPFETQTQEDPSLYIGETVTITEGKAGTVSISSETVYKNGAQQSSKIVSEDIILHPVNEIVRVGTKPKDVLKSGLFYPLNGVISSPFGTRWGKNHEGIDIAVPEGTPVKAAEGGKISFAGVNGGYGNFIKIDHGNGVVTAYAHLSKIQVKKGETVTSDTQIGLSGNTGRSTGPHLHFEVVKDGIPLNPDLYLTKKR